MIRIQLSEQEARELEAALRSTRDRKHRGRLQIVLLAHQGRPRQDIASGLRVNLRSVQRWLNASCENGLAGLLPRKAPGKKHGIPASQADEVKRQVIEGPAAQGLDQVNREDRCPPVPLDVPLPARRPRQAGPGQRRHRGAE